MKEVISKLELILLKVESHIENIYKENDLMKLEEIENIGFNGIVDFHSEILDHKASISFNNKGLTLSSCVKLLYSNERDEKLLTKRKSKKLEE